jgi:hypothetical protein
MNRKDLEDIYPLLFLMTFAGGVLALAVPVAIVTAIGVWLGWWSRP